MFSISTSGSSLPTYSSRWWSSPNSVIFCISMQAYVGSLDHDSMVETRNQLTPKCHTQPAPKFNFLPLPSRPFLASSTLSRVNAVNFLNRKQWETLVPVLLCPQPPSDYCICTMKSFESPALDHHYRDQNNQPAGKAEGRGQTQKHWRNMKLYIEHLNSFHRHLIHES